MADLDQDMLNKLKNYLVTELNKKELTFNVKFGNPSSFNFKQLFQLDPFVDNLVSIMTLTEESKKNDKNSAKKAAKDTKLEEDLTKDNQSVSDEVNYLDNLFERIDDVMADTRRNSIKLLSSFSKLRENYFKLSSIQKRKKIQKNPDLILQFIEFEDILVKHKILFPTEIDDLANLRNLKGFNIKLEVESKNKKMIKKILKEDVNAVEDLNTKNKILFRNFMENVGVDMEFTEKCFDLNKANNDNNNKKLNSVVKDIDFESAVEIDKDYLKNLKIDMKKKIVKMNQYERVQKLTNVTKFIEYLQLHMGDSIESKNNYIVENFELMFGFETKTRKLLEDETIVRELNQMTEKYDIVDHDHTNNPQDGSNWELLCLYCHDNEHAKYTEHEANPTRVDAGDNNQQTATYNPFADLQSLLKK